MFLILTCVSLDTSTNNNPQVVEIFFNTATYDEIKKDRKVTFEAQLGVIGGTMGLLTGFSIISSVEIIYFIVNFFLSLKPTDSVAKIKVQIN